MSSIYIKQSGELLLASEFKILLAGIADSFSGWHGTAVSPSFSRVYYMLGGDGFVLLPGQTIPMQKDHLYILPAGLSLEFACLTEISQLFFHVLLTDNSGRDLLSVCGRLLETPCGDAPALCDLFYSARPEDALLLRSRVYSDVIRLLCASGTLSEHPKQYSECVQKAIRYISSNLSMNLTLREISSALLVSESLLTKRFRHEVGVPIGRYTDDACLSRAEQLLIATELSLKEISDNLGFCDQFYFSRRFRQKYLLSPSEYRKQQRK